jgi:hypothetical protein
MGQRTRSQVQLAGGGAAVGMGTGWELIGHGWRDLSQTEY